MAKAETALGVKLPASYISLLRRRNGGELRLCGFPSRRKLPAWYGPRRVYLVAEIGGIHEEWDSLLSRAEAARRFRVPRLLVPFAGDGHSWPCFDYRQGGPHRAPSVTHVDCESESIRTFQVARSFEDLLRGLAFDTGDQFIFAIDDPELAGDGLHERVRPLGCRARRIAGDARGAPPRAWRWPKYRASFVDEPADFFLYKNGDIDAWHLARPPKHPLLLLDVHREDQDAAVKELLGALSGAVSLIHVPMDRGPIRGAPVAPPPRDLAAAARLRPPKPIKVGPTDLNAAVLARDQRRVAELLEVGAKPDRRYGPRYATALEMAASHGLESIFDLLMRHAGRRPTRALLTGAVRGGSKHIVKQVLDAGVKPQPGDLVAAIITRDIHLVRLLLDHGVKPSEEACKRAAGVSTPGEIGFPTKPSVAIMRLIKNAGLKSSNTGVRGRFERLT